MDFAEPLGKMLGALAAAFGAQGAEAKHAAAAAIAFNHAISGGARRGGVHTQHAKKAAVCSRRERHAHQCTARQRAGPQFFRDARTIAQEETFTEGQKKKSGFAEAENGDLRLQKRRTINYCAA